MASVPQRRILVVEDNDDARETLRMLLQVRGHHVEVADAGRRAAEQALTFAPDIALVDIGLPDVDGYEVAREIRRHPAGARIFLVALTGYGSPADRELAASAGFDAHLVKPVDLGALEQLLANLKR